MAFGSGLAPVMLNDVDAAMVRVNVADTLTVGDSESVTVAFTVKLPTRQVLPEMAALGVPELNVNPEGSPVIVQVYGVAPPDAVTIAPAPEGP